jgi:uncharacterized protein (TIGR02001 family)
MGQTQATQSNQCAFAGNGTTQRLFVPLWVRAAIPIPIQEGCSMFSPNFKTSAAFVALAMASLTAPAFAEDEAAAEEETKAITINGTATVVSDYRFRGISQTDKSFAVQGSVTATHESGLYASVWGSSIDEYVAAGGDQEIDLIAGYKKTFGGTTVDAGGIYYYYPGSSQIIPNYNSDFFEAYGSVSQAIGPVTAKVAVNYAPSQAALDYGFGKEDNLYANLGLSTSISGIGLSAGIGRTFTKSFLSGGIKYTDWSVGASYTTGPLTLGVTYVDTNASGFNPLSGKDIYKGGFLGTLGVSF